LIRIRWTKGSLSSLTLAAAAAPAPPRGAGGPPRSSSLSHSCSRPLPLFLPSPLLQPPITPNPSRPHHFLLPKVQPPLLPWISIELVQASNWRIGGRKKKGVKEELKAILCLFCICAAIGEAPDPVPDVTLNKVANATQQGNTNCTCSV
jgi:hypothetical protein